MSKITTLATNGLMTDPGPFSGAPDGALVEAQNVVVDRRGLIEPRGGIKLNGTSHPAGYRVQHGIQGASFVRTWAESGGVWDMRGTGAITGPTSFTKGRVHSATARARVLFTSEDGVCESPVTGAGIAYRAGLPQPSIAAITLTNMAPFTNWLPNGSSVAYRLTYSRRRADGVIMESAPTAPIIVRNSSGGSLGTIVSYTPYAVNSTFDVVLSTDMINIYRGPVLSSLTGTPSDVMRLRASVPVSAPGLIDRLADSDWNGPFLYTNATQEGIGQARARPPYARDITLYNGMALYAGLERPQRVVITCKAIGDIAADPSQALCSKPIVGSITVGSPNITGISATDGAYIAVGQYVTDGVNSRPNAANAKFAANTTIVSYNPGTGVAVASSNALVTAAAGTIVVWDWVGVTDGATTYRQFAKPLTSTLGTAGVNDIMWRQEASAAGTDQYGYPALETQWNVATTRVQDVLLHASGVDDVGGKPELRNVLMVFERASLSATTFAIKSSKPSAFDRVVDSVTGVTSATDGNDARLGISVPSIPDAVPELNYIDIGDTAYPIYRVVAAKDTVYIVKGDGLYMAFGQSPTSLTVQLVDSTIVPPSADIAANWVTVRGDTLYMMSTRGPVAVTGQGVATFGQDVMETFREELRPSCDIASTLTACAAGSSAAHPYVLFSWVTAGDVSRTFVYNTLSNTWTTWTARGRVTAMWDGIGGLQSLGMEGRVGTYYDRRDSMGAPITATTWPLTGDLYDPLVGTTATINSVTPLGSNTYTIVIATPSLWTPTVGDVMIRSGVLCIVESVASASTFNVVSAGVPTVGTATWEEGYPIRLIWSARTLGTVAAEKMSTSVEFAFALRALLLRMNAYYQSAYAVTGVQTVTQPQITSGWDAGATALLASPDVISVPVPSDVSLDWGMRIGFTIQQARAWFSLGAVTVDARESSARVGRFRA